MPQINPILSGEINCLEDVLDKTGWGVYSKFMVGVYAICLFSQATALTAVSFAIPLSICDLRWTKTGLVLVYMAFTFGRAIGGFILSHNADVNGRKRAMNLGLLAGFFATFCIAFAHSYLFVLLACVVLGSGLEATINAVKVHLAEIMPLKVRGSTLVLIDCFWTTGYILVALITIYLKKFTIVEHRAVDMHLTIWRMIFALSGGLNLIIACTTALLEESPRFLLYYKKNHLALLILKQFYTINKSSYSETLKLREAHINNLVKDYNLVVPHTENYIQHITNTVCRTVKSIKLMFTRRFFCITMTLILMKLSIAFSFLEVNLVSANFMNVFDSNKVLEMSGPDFYYFEIPQDFEQCIFVLNSNFYLYFFLLGSCLLLGQIFLMVVIDCIGRKIPIFLAMMVSGLSYILIECTSNQILRGFLFSFVLFSLGILKSGISVVCIESYPTAIRGSALGFLNLYEILPTLFIIRMTNIDFKVLFLVLAALFFCSGSVSLLMKENKKKPMTE